MKLFRDLVAVVLTIATLSLFYSCKKDNKHRQTENNPKEKAAVIVLDDKEQSSVVDVEEDGTVVFNGTDISDDLKKGMIICSEPTENAPYGFLYKVKSVTVKDGKTYLETEQATLEDAIEECHVKESFDVTDNIDYIEFGDGSAYKVNTSGTKAEVSGGLSLPFKIKICGDKVLFSASPEDLEVITPASDDGSLEVIEYVGDDIKGTASISAEIGVTVGVQLTLGIELDVEDWTVNHFALWGQPELTVKAEAGVVLEGRADFKDIEIARMHLAPVTVMAGFVPVVITPTLGLYGDVSVSGKLKFKTKLIDLDFGYKAGVDYTDGKWTLISDNMSKEPSFFELDKNFKSTLEGELKIVPSRIAISPGLYNIDTGGNLYTGIAMPFKISVEDIDIGDALGDYYVNPRIKGTWGVEVSAKAKLTVLKHELVDFNPKFTPISFTLFDRNLFPKISDLSIEEASSDYASASFSITNCKESFFRRFMDCGICYSEVNGGAWSLQQFGADNYYVSIGGDGLYWDKDDSNENIDIRLMIPNLKPSTNYYARPFFTTILDTKYGHIVDFNTDMAEDIPVPEAVDMGLSVKWASFNVGATKPEEYGKFYAWGETEAKDYYWWTTYKWGDNNSLIRYNSNSSKGIVDNKSDLSEYGYEDDVARVKLGAPWRIPTVGEFNELVGKCEWSWVSRDGIGGYEVKGPSGYVIFLPAAGNYSYSGYNLEGYVGDYWASSINTPETGNELFFNMREYIIMATQRSYGNSVRPVYGSGEDGGVGCGNGDDGGKQPGSGEEGIGSDPEVGGEGSSTGGGNIRRR